MDKYGGGAKGPKLDLRPCKYCGRTFVPESLVKHQANCQNVQKKRKVFDTTKQRATEDLSVRQIKAAQKKSIAPPKSHWKQKHEEFIRNIRAAKHSQHAMDMGLPLPPPPPPSENPDYITCPYCNRRFNEKAAARHIDFCKTKQQRLPAKREPTAQEKKRAAAQKYQPPKPKGRDPPMDAPSSGGYSSRGGYGAAPRGAPPGRAGPTGSRSDQGRAPAGYGASTQAPRGTGYGASTQAPRSTGGYGSSTEAPRSTGGYGSSTQAPRGRAPAGGATRGRTPAASQGSYAPSRYADPGSIQNDRSTNDPLRVLSGSSLKLRQHNEASKSNTRKVASQRQSVLSASRGGTDGNQQMSSHKFSSYSSSSPGNGLRATDSGYHSSSSEIDSAVPRIRKTRPVSGPARFCHECGTKYPMNQAKFCGECGIKRADVSIR